MPYDQAKNMGIQKRRQTVADLYLKGWTQAAIADEVGVCQTTICFDLKRIRKLWLESTVRDFDEARQIELLKIDRLEREAWAAWERSQKPAQSAVVYTDTGRERTRRSTKNQNGDPRYLEQVHKCIAMRCVILGLNAPTKVAATTPDGQALTFEQRQQHIQAILVENYGIVVNGDLVDGANDSSTTSRSIVTNVRPGPSQAESSVVPSGEQQPPDAVQEGSPATSGVLEASM